MARVDASGFARKWASRTQAASSDYAAGVQRVSSAPGAAAAKQADVMVQQVAQNKDKYARNVAAVSLQEWQQASLTKGVQRIASGVTAAEPKMAAIAAPLLQAVDSAVSEAKQIPRGSLEQNLQRANKFATAMSKFRKR